MTIRSSAACSTTWSRKFGYEPVIAESGEQAVALLTGGERFDCVVLDLVMPDLDGMGVLARLREAGINVPVIVQTAHGGIDNVVSAMRAGAVDFVVKPVGAERLQVSLAQRDGQERARRRAQPHQARQVRHADASRTSSPAARAMQAVLRTAEKAAASTIPVLIEGESGVGKELIARAIHGSSERRARPFIAVNCGAIPENLVESILFGHEKGAFTGATERHTGKFIEATGGTLFLDEVGELPPAAQVKLLRAIQEGEVEPVGARKPVKVDVRLVSATNRNLIADVKTGRFREDLFYRLHVFPIAVPPLRERAEDIPDLARHFLARFAAEEGKRIRAVSAEALALLGEPPLAGQRAPARERGVPRRGAGGRRHHRRRRVPAGRSAGSRNAPSRHPRCRTSRRRPWSRCRSYVDIGPATAPGLSPQHRTGHAGRARRRRRGPRAGGDRGRRHPLRHRPLPRADVRGRAPVKDWALHALPQAGIPRTRRQRRLKPRRTRRRALTMTSHCSSSCSGKPVSLSYWVIHRRGGANCGSATSNPCGIKRIRRKNFAIPRPILGTFVGEPHRKPLDFLGLFSPYSRLRVS